MCAPRGQHVAGQGAGQEVPAGQHQHPGAEAWQQVQGQGLLPGGVRAERRPGQRAGPGLRRGDPPHLRARPVPGRTRGPAEERDVILAVRQVGGRAIDGDHPKPAAEHPVRAVRADRARDLLERPPPADLPGIDPARRVQLPGQQVRAAPPVINV